MNLRDYYHSTVISSSNYDESQEITLQKSRGMHLGVCAYAKNSAGKAKDYNAILRRRK
jgi:hypothetical protein